MNHPPHHTISADFAREAWRKLFFISLRLRTTSFGILDRDFDCSLAQFPIVQFFFTYPNATPAIKDLTSYIGLPSGAVSQAVDGLVREAVLARIPSEKDKRSTLIRATDELIDVRSKALDHFTKMLESFKSLGYITPEEVALGDELFVRLAESRTGGELSVVRNPADLSVPGLLKHRFIDPEQLRKLPSCVLNMHFVTVLKGPALEYYYETSGRMTLGKLRLLDHMFILSEFDERPKVKDLAERFRISSGVTSQTLNALIQDGVMERIPSPGERDVIRVRLTRQGLRIRRLTAATYTKFMENFFSTVEPEKAEIFSHILDRFLEFLEKEGKSFLLPDPVSVSFYRAE